MLAAARTTRRSSRPTRSACPSPTAPVDGVTCGFALRNFVDLGRFFAELAGSSAPAGASPCWRWPSRRTAFLRWGHGVYFGKVVPGSAACSPTAPPTATCPKSVAYLPEPGEMLALLGEAGFADVDRDAAVPSASPS